MLPGTYKKREFTFGRQDIAPIGGIKSVFYVMPSSSARCAAFPTSDTKLPWFREIKALKGIVINQSRARRKYRKVHESAVGNINNLESLMLESLRSCWKIFNLVLGNQKLLFLFGLYNKNLSEYSIFPTT